MEIRFGIWKYERVNGRRKTISKNDVIELPITLEQFESDIFNTVHKMIKDAIYAKHPGWYLMGYCPKGHGRE